MQPRQTINATPVQPPVYSLLTVAPPAALPEQDWLAGFQWNPESAGLATTAGVLAIACVGDTAAMGSDPVAPSTVGWDPFVVWALDACSSFGYRAHDYAGRARRALAAVESFQVAKELWAGALDTATASMSNLALNSTTSDEMTTAAVSPLLALGLLEEGIAVKGQGRRGMIHCTPQALIAFQAEGGLRFQNGVWLTAMGTIVVADAGYDGSAPGGAAPTTTQWAYGTEVLEVLLSAPMLFPQWDPSTDAERFMAEALDRSVNKMIVYAVRAASIKWDRQIHVGAELSLPWPAFGGS